MRCPNCRKDIEFLYSASSGTVFYKVSLDSFGDVQYEMLVPEDNGDSTYSCPECDSELFSDDGSATAFLKGK